MSTIVSILTTLTRTSVQMYQNLQFEKKKIMYLVEKEKQINFACSEYV